MAALIFWLIIVCVTFFTVGFMVCAVAEYLSNNLEKRIDLHEWKRRFIRLDVIPVIALIIMWVL
jgi:K+-transporting ATPase A subunit